MAAISQTLSLHRSMPAVTSKIHSQIESPHPLQAAGGAVSVEGWCFYADAAVPPPIRLSTKSGILSGSDQIERTDVASLFPSSSAAISSGFHIKGTLPSGIHQLQFEAQDSDGNWQCFKELSIAVTPEPFSAVLDTPISAGTLHDRVKVGGWALHPDGPLVELSLRYGHRDLPCKIGLPRTDVSALFPHNSRAATSGFESSDFLWAGHGPVRLCGKLADGRTVFATTNVSFSIDRDENHEPELDLTVNRIELPQNKHLTIEASSQTTDPLNIIFVLHGSFAANSAMHVAALANELCGMGHDCAVSVTHDLETISQLFEPAFRSVLHQDSITDIRFENKCAPDIIHAWTTRENVRQLTENLRVQYDAKVVVHLEDNEQQILAHSLSRPYTELEKLSDKELEPLIQSDLSHPKKARSFLNAADGVTIITEKLSEFVPEGHPCHLITPAADARYFHPQAKPTEFRHILDPSTNETVIFYHGNVHAANASEVRELYVAVLKLNQRGHATTLLRTGIDTVDFLGDLTDQVSAHVLNLGQISHHHRLPALMALADIFVQPGSADPFNDYRFPSKLPEFFSIGRPVILPRTNLGHQLRHGTDAYVLEKADSEGITHAVQAIRNDPELYRTLSSGAVNYARDHFSWRRSAETLANFYTTLARS